MDGESRSQASDSQVRSWRRDAVDGGTVGLIAVVLSFALGYVAWPVFAWLFLLGLSLPGIYFGGLVAFTWGPAIGEYWARWTLLIASLVVNVVVFSASWALLRRSGRLARVGKLLVVAAWLSYFGLLVGSVGGD